MNQTSVGHVLMTQKKKDQYLLRSLAALASVLLLSLLFFCRRWHFYKHIGVTKAVRYYSGKESYCNVEYTQTSALILNLQ